MLKLLVNTYSYPKGLKGFKNAHFTSLNYTFGECLRTMFIFIYEKVK